MKKRTQKTRIGLCWIQLPKPYDRYEASREGEVRSKRTARTPTGGPSLKQFPSPGECGLTVQLLGSNRAHKFYVHRLIGILFNGFPKKRGMCIGKTATRTITVLLTSDLRKVKTRSPTFFPMASAQIISTEKTGDQWWAMKGYTRFHILVV